MGETIVALVVRTGVGHRHCAADAIYVVHPEQLRRGVAYWLILFVETWPRMEASGCSRKTMLVASSFGPTAIPVK